MFLKEKYWHELFEASLVLKVINGIWQSASGLALVCIPRSALEHGFLWVFQRELLEDPHDTFVTFLNTQLQHISTNAKSFVAAYLLLHGLLNIFLAYNLYRNRLWAYKVSLIFVGLFLIYLLYRFTHTHSLLLLGVLVFDVFFLIVTWHEYKHRKRRAVINRDADRAGAAI